MNPGVWTPIVIGYTNVASQNTLELEVRRQRERPDCEWAGALRCVCGCCLAE